MTTTMTPSGRKFEIVDKLPPARGRRGVFSDACYAAFENPGKWLKLGTYKTELSANAARWSFANNYDFEEMEIEVERRGCDLWISFYGSPTAA